MQFIIPSINISPHISIVCILVISKGPQVVGIRPCVAIPLRLALGSSPDVFPWILNGWIATAHGDYSTPSKPRYCCGYSFKVGSSCGQAI